MSRLEVESLVLGELDTNCYIVSCPETDQAVVIDPADSGDYITERLLSRSLQLTGIILTHGHFDHVLGLLEVKLNFSVPIMMHEADTFLLESAQDRATHWLKHSVDPVPPADAFLTDGQLLTIGHWHLRVLHTPGHTPGSMCVVGDDVLFTGDTLFKDAVGTATHSYSSKQALCQSINTIRQSSAQKVLYPGHGERFESV